MLVFSFQFPNREMTAGFILARRAVKDFREPLNLAADDFENDMEQQFSREGRPRWAPLLPSTLLDRARKGYPSGPILVRDGSLKRSLTTKGAEGHIREIHKTYAVLGTDYRTPDGRYNMALIHTEGNEHMAARPVMEVSQAALKRMMLRIHQHMQKQLGTAFKGWGYFNWSR